MVPMQTPPWQASSLVQALPSSQVVPVSGVPVRLAVPLQVRVLHWSEVQVIAVPTHWPLPSQVSLQEQASPSSQLVPVSGVTVQLDVPLQVCALHWSEVQVIAVPTQWSLPSQVSLKVQASPSSHGVLAGWRASDGQYTVVPVQVSAASHAVVSGTVMPVHTPLWQVSPVVQALPSSHGVLSGSGVPAQTPPWQVSLLVQEFSSSHAAPSSTAASPTQVPFWQASFAVQKFPSSQGVPSGWRASDGQYALVPVQVSATLHAPSPARQTVPALAAG